MCVVLKRRAKLHPVIWTLPRMERRRDCTEFMTRAQPARLDPRGRRPSVRRYPGYPEGPPRDGGVLVERIAQQIRQRRGWARVIVGGEG